ncbi:MAG: formimidoylglutamase [candidate division Zixibacteria bacterium]|nr:formimidoylglutamase [candidate division Zixibacteria bacterium]NIS47840.1 formimidoylglutamase [candidate division Zixibacteria bacterium]NIT53734.1 formimidoylglutamase [candidate division Zixibacteria bacterium]NIV08104.1 arginase [candidate division Zixibacteria bacterium]NIW42128.1 arginase [candidate division Zixibacteria bacterium]
MGEFVKSAPENYADADFVLLGCPQDEGVRRNKGKVGAKDGPAAIRRSLYKFSVPEKVGYCEIFDLGDTIVDGSLEEIHDRQHDVVLKVLQDGKRLIILGGGNDISYPDGSALAKQSNDLLVFNVDSHFDVRKENIRHSGTPYRQLLDEKQVRPDRLYEMAGKDIVNSPEYRRYLNETGAHVYPLEELRTEGIDKIFKEILNSSESEHIFWGFDLDVVQAQDAPGVSAGYPIGLTAEEICYIAKIAGNDKRSRILELTELNPKYDIHERTAKLASMMILYYLDASASIE